MNSTRIFCSAAALRSAAGWFLLLQLFLFTNTAHCADTVTVKKVISGTTFVTTAGVTIKLLGISIPRSQAVTPEDSRGALAAMLDGNQVVVVDDSTCPRTNGFYVRANGVLVNVAMIEQGYAVADQRLKYSMRDAFLAAERNARASHVGAHGTERSTAVQCSGITKKGTRCLRMTTSLSGKCWQHE